MLKHRAYQIIIALDQLFNALAFGWADETFSARCWRQRHKNRFWKVARRVVDLFAGCGTFALPLAAGAEVHAVEGEATMLAALDRGWRESQGLKRVTHETRDLFRRPLLPDELNRYDAIVIDPPRAGAEAQIREIAASELRTVAHVSCNPLTFARDAQILAEAGFRIDRMIVVDQFRWSDHVELAALFIRY